MLSLVFASRPIAAAWAENAPRARVLNLAPVAFVPSNSTAQYVVEQGGIGRLCALNGAVYFVAPLALGNGAVIDRISAFVQDRNVNSFAVLSLVRRGAEKSEVVAITPASTGAQRLEVLSADVTDGVIDSEHYSYLFQLVLGGPDVCLQGAQVTYHGP